VLESSLVYPQVDPSVKKRTNALDSLPDNLTSSECLRALSLKHHEKVKKKNAAKEKRAKQKFLAEGETGKNVQRHEKITCRKTS
jgi:hypothetical protein